MGFWSSVLTGIAIVVMWMFLTSPAECAWCPSLTCYDSVVCGTDCVCLIQADEFSGVCVSFE